MLIGLTGRAQHGKDSTGDILVKDYGFVRFAFADALKSMALVLNPLIQSEDGDVERMSSIVNRSGWETAKTYPEVRRFLQVLGTEAVRDHLGENTWVDALFNKIDRSLIEVTTGIVITDVRFPNEAEAVLDHGGHMWRVVRYSRGPSADTCTCDPKTAAHKHFTEVPFDNGLGDSHPSEAFVDRLPVDRIIRATNLTELRHEVQDVMSSYGWRG